VAWENLASKGHVGIVIDGAEVPKLVGHEFVPGKRQTIRFRRRTSKRLAQVAVVLTRTRSPPNKRAFLIYSENVQLEMLFRIPHMV